MSMLIRYLATVAAVFVTVKLVPGISAPDWTTILLVALAWSLITMFIRPVLRILTLPITVITFGLFSFILNAILFYAVTMFVPAFHVDGFLTALLGSIVLSVVSWLIHFFI